MGDKMETTRIGAILIVFIMSISFAHTDTSGIPDSSVNSMMSGMMGGYLTSPVANCSSLSESELEQYGDAIMERMVGDHELHESMEQAMDADALRIMHLSMGSEALGCSVNRTTGMSEFGMMGNGYSGMMMYMMPSMMGSLLNQQSYVAGTITWNQLIVLILIVGFGICIYLLNGINGKDRKTKKR